MDPEDPLFQGRVGFGFDAATVEMVGIVGQRSYWTASASGGKGPGGCFRHPAVSACIVVQVVGMSGCWRS
jgi:hypothetical protein